MRTPLSALVFDMDGVLVANSPFYAQAWQALGARYPELRLERCPAGETFGRRNVDLFAELIPEVPLSRQIELGTLLEAMYWESFEPHLRPIAGLKALLAEARQRGLALAVATSAPAATMARVVGGLGFLDPPRFDVILTQDDVTHGKPDPEIYLRACERLGCPPQSALVFEDALVGVQSARAAGASVIALASSYAEHRLLPLGAEFVMPDYHDPRLRPRLGWEK